MKNVKKEVEDFSNEVLKAYDAQITDSIFLFIEKDKELMKKYLDLVALVGDLQKVNQEIPLVILDHYGLKSLGTANIEENPKSNLIQTYSKLKK